MKLFVHSVAELELSFMTIKYNTNEQDQATLALEVRRGAVSNEISIPFLACVAIGSAQRECFLCSDLAGNDWVV